MTGGGNPRTAEVEIDNAVAVAGRQALERCIAVNRQMVLESQVGECDHDIDVEMFELRIDKLKSLVDKLDDVVEQTDKQMEQEYADRL
jgi:3-polyprenyl-4-hydroxybenzoate decarboxylase